MMPSRSFAGDTAGDRDETEMLHRTGDATMTPLVLSAAGMKGVESALKDFAGHCIANVLFAIVLYYNDLKTPKVGLTQN